MNITLDRDAPGWAQRFAAAVATALEVVWSRPMPGPYAIAAMPDATHRTWVGRMVRLSDGAGGMPTAVSNGTDWVYPDGSTI